MSGLWTPGGEEPTGVTGSPGGADQEPTPEEVAAAREHLERVREELSQTPVRDIVANHAIGLWQLAILHLGLDEPEGAAAERNLPEAKLAIDAMHALVEGVADRLGDHAGALRGALANLQLAYVQVTGEEGEPS